MLAAGCSCWQPVDASSWLVAVSWLALVQQVRDEPRRMRDDCDHLLVRHLGRSDDADHPRQGTGTVFRRDDREVLESRVAVLVADSDRQPRVDVTATKHLGEMLI